MGDSMGSSMSMSMTFGSFSDYQLQLLFSSWDIETRAQLAGAWFAVFFAVIVSHGLRYYISIVEQDMRSVNAKLTLEGVGKETSSLLGGQSPFVKGTSTIYEKIKLKLVHASLSAVNYGMALLLMLVAMTYNPTLFLALIVGYFVGDLIFFQPSNGAVNSDEDSGLDCH